MKKLMLLLICSILLCPNFAGAEDLNNNLLITQMQTGPDEFIEIFNPTDETINLANYRIEYYSSTAIGFGSPSQSIPLDGQIHPDGYIVVASTGYLTESATAHFSKTLADTGGAIRLAQSIDNIWSTIDVLGWGSAKLFENSAHPKAGDNKSLSRISLNSEFIDTDDNSTDFVINPAPTPNFVNVAPTPNENTTPTTPDAPTDEEQTPEDGSQPDDQPAQEEVIAPNSGLQPPYITELFPDPASPLTDAEDEYVELYNPNGATFDLDGYKLQTGNNYSYSFSLDGLEIPPLGYLVLYAKDTNLTLSNTSSRARLLDKSGASVSETDMYSEAEEGQTWALIGGVWQWTTSASPGALNILAIPTAGALLKSSTKSPKASKATTAKAKTASTKSSKSSAPKKATSKKEDKGPANNFEQTANTQKTHPLMLGGAGLFALSYGLYEYRFEFSNFLRRFGKGRIFGSESS